MRHARAARARLARRVRRSRHARHASVLLCAAVVGCGSPPPTGPLTPCNVDLRHNGAPTFSADALEPQIGWEPACVANRLTVTDSFSGEVAWDVTTPAGNDLAPGVRYGVAPPGAQEVVGPAKPLVSGHKYFVAVFVDVASAAGRPQLAAWGSYTP